MYRSVFLSLAVHSYSFARSVKVLDSFFRQWYNRDIRRDRVQNRNYSKELDSVIEKNRAAGVVPSLLLHACCAPCSSYCLEYLSDHFRITVFYYNPNIYPPEEYEKRVSEIRRLIREMPARYPVDLIEGEYDPGRFFAAAKGLENVREGGERCAVCFRLRLEETARAADEGGFDFFTTTLTISPLKNAGLINSIGESIDCKAMWLPSDFKKKNGYKRSIELSKEYGLYRQNFCGCVYSKNSREQKEERDG